MAPREAQRHNGGCNGLPVPFRETNQAVALRQRAQQDRNFDFWIGEALTNPLLRVRVVITRSWIILSIVDYRRSPGGNPTVSTFTLELPQERDPTDTAVSVRRAFELLGDRQHPQGRETDHSQAVTPFARSLPQNGDQNREPDPSTVDSLDSFLHDVGVGPDPPIVLHRPWGPVVRPTRWFTPGLRQGGTLDKISSMAYHGMACPRSQRFARRWVMSNPATKMVYVLTSCVGCRPTDRRLEAWMASWIEPHSQDDLPRICNNQSISERLTGRPQSRMAHLATWDSERRVWCLDAVACSLCKPLNLTNTSPSRGPYHSFRQLMESCEEVTFCRC